MSYFILPQSWIAPAVVAAVTAFGSLNVSPVKIVYRNLPGQSVGQSRPPQTIILDKRDQSEWTIDKARCVIVHEYGHLRGRPHSENPRSIMYYLLTQPNCERFLRRHRL